MKHAVVLLSGGLDSATTLAIARLRGYETYALSFDYGQRHRQELDAARKIANSLAAKEHRIIKIDNQIFAGSALINDVDVPKSRSKEEIGRGIPPTYVPARNTIFLAHALAWAETIPALPIRSSTRDLSRRSSWRRRMKNIFDLTKREQRLVIVIVTALVAATLAKHFWENRSQPLPASSTSTPTSSPSVHAEEEQPD